MSKIKEWFLNISKTIKQMFASFPLTVGIIFIVTTIFSICVEQTWVNREFYINAILFGAIFAASTMFTESNFKKWQYRIMLYVIGAFIAAIFTLIINPCSVGAITSASAIAIRLAAGYVIILILLSMFKILKKSKYKFEEYILKVFANLFMCSITYFILNIGITLVSLIFIELILNGFGGEFILRVQIMLFGYFFINSLLYSISNVGQKNVNVFVKSLIIYVGMPLITISIGIIYLYIIKIIVLRNMPTNVIFRILAGIFICAFPVWNMASSFKDIKFAVKVSKILPYAFCPFILLEIYSIGVRVINYGLTPFRYICIMFIVFQIVSLLFTFIKNKKFLSDLFLVASVIVLILFISPLNYDIVSSISQKHIITTLYKVDTDLSSLGDDDKRQIVDAYLYLDNSAQYAKYIPSYVNKDKIEKLQNEINHSTVTDRTNHLNSKYISADVSLNMDISNYSTIAFVNLDNFNGDTTNVVLSSNNYKTVNVNLKYLIDGLISISNNKFNEKLQQSNIVKIDDRRDIFISSIDITYNPSNNKIENLSVSGYVLNK